MSDSVGLFVLAITLSTFVLLAIGVMGARALATRIRRSRQLRAEYRRRRLAAGVHRARLQLDRQLVQEIAARSPADVPAGDLYAAAIERIIDREGLHPVPGRAREISDECDRLVATRARAALPEAS